MNRQTVFSGTFTKDTKNSYHGFLMSIQVTFWLLSRVCYKFLCESLITCSSFFLSQHQNILSDAADQNKNDIFQSPFKLEVAVVVFWQLLGTHSDSFPQPSSSFVSSPYTCPAAWNSQRLGCSSISDREKRATWNIKLEDDWEWVPEGSEERSLYSQAFTLRKKQTPNVLKPLLLEGLNLNPLCLCVLFLS